MEVSKEKGEEKNEKNQLLDCDNFGSHRSCRSNRTKWNDCLKLPQGTH